MVNTIWGLNWDPYYHYQNCFFGKYSEFQIIMNFWKTQPYLELGTAYNYFLINYKHVINL